MWLQAKLQQASSIYKGANEAGGTARADPILEAMHPEVVPGELITNRQRFLTLSSPGRRVKIKGYGQ